jgi:transcriptional regulator with XRE-family HTH domain
MNDPLDTKLNLGSKIRFFRELKGLSQEALAIDLGISQQAFQRIESGVTKLDIDRANLIAEKLGVELELLLNFNPANYWYNCSLSGNGTFTNNTSIPAELIQSYETQIQHMKEEINFLRGLLNERR